MEITYTDENGVRQTVVLSDQTVREIHAIAEQSHISFSQAIQQVIASGSFLEAVQAAGGRIIVEQDKQLRTVEREPQAV